MNGSIALDDSGRESLALAGVLEQTMERVAARQGDDIEEEECRVIDLIRELRKRLRLEPKLSIDEIFTPNKSRVRLIVTFLAILEMMKLGELAAFREENGPIYITPQVPQEHHG